MILAIDPGTTVSTWVKFNRVYVDAHSESYPEEVDSFGRDVPNNDLDFIKLCIGESGPIVVIEDIEMMGMTVGYDVFQTVRWTGRFQQICADWGIPCYFLKRSKVKLHLCNSARAQDKNIRQALLDRFGDGSKQSAIGLKATPGPLYGIAGHAWSALALAVTWADQAAKRGV